MIISTSTDKTILRYTPSSSFIQEFHKNTIIIQKEYRLLDEDTALLIRSSSILLTSGEGFSS